MSRDDMKGGRIVPVGNRNSRIGRNCHTGSHTRHNLKVNTGISKRLSLLASPAKYKGITAFEPQHMITQLGLPNENLVNLFLRNKMMVRPLPHIDGPGIRRNQA